MTKLNDIEKIEHELADLRQRLQESFAILDKLAVVQRQFKDLAQTYKELKSHTDRAYDAWSSIETLANTVVENASTQQSSLERRFGELETGHDTYIKKLQGEVKQEIDQLENHFGKLAGEHETQKRAIEDHFASLQAGNTEQWAEYQAASLDTQNKLYAAFSNLRKENNAQITNLKGEVEQRIGIFLTDWDKYKAMVNERLEKLENQRLTEFESLKVTFQQLQADTVQRLERTEGQLRKAGAAYQNVNKQIRSLRIWVIAGFALVGFMMFLLAIGIIWPFL